MLSLFTTIKLKTKSNKLILVRSQEDSRASLVAQRLKCLPALGRKIPWRRKWQPTPVLLAGESHGGRSLVDYSPWGRKESDTTERFHYTL